MARRRQRNSRDSQERTAGARGHHLGGEKRTAEFAGGDGDSPQPAQRQAGECGARIEIVAQAGRAGAVTIATNMAGRGTDIILGGNSDYMARLKLREVLLGRLAVPEDDHKPLQPLQRSANAAGSLMPWSHHCPAAVRALSLSSPTTPIKPSASWRVIWSRPGATVPSR